MFVAPGRKVQLDFDTQVQLDSDTCSCGLLVVVLIYFGLQLMLGLCFQAAEVIKGRAILSCCCGKEKRVGVSSER